MEYSQISKVVVLKKVSDVNEYLDLGWILLNVYLTAYDTQPPGSNHQTANYVLGWQSGFPPEEPKYPESRSTSE